MIRPRSFAVVLVSAVVALTGCSADGTDSSATSTGSGTDLLAAYELDGKSTEEIIESLDQTNDDRDQQLVGSVRYDELLLTDGSQEITLPIESGDFYLAVAPYVSSTHECYYHNLASCQGELVGEEIDVTITASSGDVLVDETAQTYDNGFVAFWLPRDITGTIEMSYDGKTVTAPIATGPDSPTCVTTLQLIG